MILSSRPLQFKVMGKPTPKPRPRVGKNRVVYPRHARGSRQMDYPEYKQLVQMEARNALIESDSWDGAVDPEGGYILHLWFHLRTRSDGDVENLAGTIMDALQGLIYKDDKQVDSLFVCRLLPGDYAYQDLGEPHVSISIGCADPRE